MRMTNEDQQHRQLSHDSKLRHWQSLYETALHSDRVAAEIGIFVLKVVMVINGSALIALLAAYPNFKPHQLPGYLSGTKFFFWGLLIAALASGLSYFYQGFVTAMSWNNLNESVESKPPFPAAAKFAKPFIIAVILLTVCSYILFSFGGYSVLEAIAVPKPLSMRR